MKTSKSLTSALTPLLRSNFEESRASTPVSVILPWEGTKFEFNEEFFSLWFYVDKRVLVPRNDTETMVYQVLKELTPPWIHLIEGESWVIAKREEFTFIDIGTGSSAILTATLKNIKAPLAWAFWLDISLDALEVAKINIEKHGLQNQVILTQSDLLEVFLNRIYSFPSKNIVITANLPYIKNGDFENMDQEVLDNEPHIALFGWEETGFEMYERLIEQIQELKNRYFSPLDKGEMSEGQMELEVTLFIEIGFDQYNYSKQYLENLSLSHQFFKDLNGIQRIIKINI